MSLVVDIIFYPSLVLNYRVLSPTSGMWVKKLQPKVKSPKAWEAAKRLFEAEAVVLHALGHHDQIPHLTAHFEEAQQLYLIQEYIPGWVLNPHSASSKSRK